MKFFLDTANLEEIRQAASLGVLDGITTNPSLVAKEKRPFREHILEICEIVKPGVVNVEVVSTDTAGMLREGREFASWHPNIVVKVPMTPDGLRAQYSGARGHSHKRHAGLFPPASADRGEGRRGFCQIRRAHR